MRVTGDDWSRLGPDAERLAHFAGRGNEAFMRMRDGHCAALELRPTGAAGAGLAAEYFCTVYARRPQTCRDLGRGTPACLGELAKGRGGGDDRLR